MTEGEIILGCKAQNRIAQKLFVEEYSRYLFAVCRRYIYDQELAKDCLQESLVEILQKIGKYNEEGKFKSWIATITVRKCLRQIKAIKKHQYTEMESVTEPGCEDKTLLKLEHNDVMKFINTLPENYRIVINMYLVEGFSHKEISDELGINESSSRSILTRAKKMINKAFEDEKMKVVYKNKKKLIS